MSVDILTRKLIKVVVGNIVQECGFEKTQEVCLEVLCEIYAAFLREVVQTTKAYAELAGRTQPLVTDVVMAFTELGFDYSGLQKPSQLNQCLLLSRLIKATSPNSTASKVLKVGETKTLTHAPSYLPSLPDPHTYIKTYAPISALSDYQELRKKISTQKDNTEKALSRFIAMTGATENLFPEDPYAFPLIASRVTSLPENVIMKEDMEEDEEEEEEEGERAKMDEGGKGEEGEEDAPIDNPYLKPIIMPDVS